MTVFCFFCRRMSLLCFRKVSDVNLAVFEKDKSLDLWMIEDN